MNDIAAFLDDRHAERVGQLLEEYSGQQPIEIGVTGFDAQRSWERWHRKQELAPDLVGVDVSPAIDRFVDAYLEIAGSEPADHPMAQRMEQLYDERLDGDDDRYDLDIHQAIQEEESLVAADARRLDEAVGPRSSGLVLACGLFGQVRRPDGSETYDDPVDAYREAVDDILDAAYRTLDDGGRIVVSNEYEIHPTGDGTVYGVDHFRSAIDDRFEVEERLDGDIYTLIARRTEQ